MTDLTKISVDSVIAEFADKDDSVARTEWLNVVTADIQGAIQQCFRLRKQGNCAAVASYYLAKMIFNFNPEKGLNVFAWCALSAVKALRAEAFEKRKSYHERIVGIVKELSLLKIDGKSEYDKILIEQIRHYKTEYLATEDHLAEAFNEQRAIYLANPNDVDNLRALGWTLHDCLRQSMETLKNRKLVQFFLNELSCLKYPEEMKARDEILVNCRDSDIRKAKDFLDGTGEVRALMKGGNLDAALGLAIRLVENEPQNTSAHLALGEIYDGLKQYRKALKVYLLALKLDAADAKAQLGATWAFVRYVSSVLKKGWAPTAKDFLPDALGQVKTVGSQVGRDVMQLGLVEKLTELPKPSLAYSQLLRVYTKIAKSLGKDVPCRFAQKYLEVVGTWGLENLSDEDWKPFVPKDKPTEKYPSLVENVVSALYRCGCVEDDVGRALILRFPWAVDFVGEAVGRFPEQQWFPYYCGKLLVEQGKCEEARRYVIETVRHKMSEFWVWQILAETYPQDIEWRLACLCRAMLCPVKDESFLVAVHKMLAECFLAKGMMPEAAFEYGKVDAIRKSKGWRIVPRVREIDGVAPAKDNALLYKELGEKADAVVLENVPSVAAVVTARYVDRETKADIVRIWWQDDSSSREVRVKAKSFAALKKAKPGTPLAVWVNVDNGKRAVLKVERRQGADDWDVYPKQVGVLSARDERHGKSYFTIGDKGESCFGDWAVHPALKALGPGTVCELAVSIREGKAFAVLAFSVLTDGNLPSFARDFAGTLQLPEGRRFGFVEGGVFVPDSLVGKVENGACVRGVAVRAFDRVKSKVGWKAVTLVERK